MSELIVLAKEWGINRLPNDDAIPNDIKSLVEQRKSAKTGDTMEDEDSDEDERYDDGNEMQRSTLSMRQSKRINRPEQISSDNSENEAIRLPPKSFVQMQSDRLGGDGEQINSNQLLEIVKKYPFVYNPFHPKFRERTLRKKGWERICADMFPEYPNCSEEIKFEIGYKLRRRWTSLRAKTSGEARDCLKSGKMLRPELQFLLPYMISPQCERLTKELGIKRLPNDDIIPDDMEVSKESDDNEDYDCRDIFDDPLCDNVLPGSSDNDSRDGHLFHRNYLNINDFLDMSSSVSERRKPRQATCREQKLSKRNLSGERAEAERRRQLIDYLEKFKKRLLHQEFDVGKDENDKDRLFLLSLTDDFKQIPAHKKIFVKAKIATVLIHAMQK